MPEVNIGLETHVQLDTDTKLFCGCLNAPADEPNTHTCPTCLGHPGAKPRMNAAAIEAGLRTGLALGCDIADQVVMARKTYFYPDMSKNYQISQYDQPIASDGALVVDGEEIGIRRAHIEEDPAKLEHVGGDMASADYTRVDYNRAGVPLLEIVTEPAIVSPEHARAFLQRLIRIMEYLDLYDRDTGTVRSDANISVGEGNRVEVKNITGTRAIQDALEHELQRQERLQEHGEAVERETRTYDAADEVTRSMRTKETEQDYGYIAEPDLVTVAISEEDRQAAEETLPELPQAKRDRFQQEYNVGDELADALVTDPALADAFEAAADAVGADLAASWFSGPVKKTLNYHDLSYRASPLRQEWIVTVLEKLAADDLSDRAAETVIRELVEQPRDPEEIIEEEGLEKAGGDEMEELIVETIAENQSAVEDYRDGDEDALNYLVGQVMEKSGGSADPKESRAMLQQELEDGGG